MKRIIWIVLLALVAIGGVVGKMAYDKYLKPLVKENTDFYIATGTTLDQLEKQLLKSDLIIDEESFQAMAAAQNFEKVYPGKYLLKKGLSQWKLISKLRSGTVETVKVTFQSIRDLDMLAGKVGQRIEADSANLVRALRNQDLIDSAGGIGSIYCNMVPNTYDLYWNTNAEEFVKRMVKENQKFWNEDRRKKAEGLGLTPCEVVTVASLVQEEQQVHRQEHSVIAGLYINRVNKGMKLESDPTLKYIAGDFTIEPNNSHKKIKSPYNTYDVVGLPPGPIVIPDVSTINATLNRDDNDYIFMCAKDDFSGLHNFARTFEQHKINARKYRRALRAQKRAARKS